MINTIGPGQEGRCARSTILRRSGALAGTAATVFRSDFVGMETRFVGIVTPAEREGVNNINGLD
jgi:hypothetical protein